ncbi:MAG: hypothetical protein WC549_00145 [Actinomycetota bacterium]
MKDIQAYKSVIIGYGVVGQATSYALKIPDYYNKDSGNIDIDELTRKKHFFLCLPTLTKNNGEQDLQAIHYWLKFIKNKVQTKPIVIIRSTILPGTTDYLSKKYKLEIAHIPEFLTEATAIEDELYPEFIVIGCRNLIIREKLKEIFTGNLVYNKRFILCDPTTAELIKYSMNCFFALKVIYANQIFDVAKKSGANYEQVKKTLEAHKWGSKNGWDVWQGGYRGFGGHCLRKDLKSFVSKYHPEGLSLLNVAEKINEGLIKESK